MRFIGDVHGNIDEYIALTEGVEKSIQVGDMGIGFSGVELPILSPCHRFIRGNHDNPAECAKHPNWIKDGTFNVTDNIFYVGGAWSIDFEWRQQYEMDTGVKVWWPTEECSVHKLQKIIDSYTAIKPEIVVTHDCPTIMAHETHSHHSRDKSKTRQALDAMFEAHKPDIWIFGHHHTNMTKDIAGTRFFCLDELAVLDMED